jgi:tRNA G37 N-methylase Trm5
LEEKKFREKNVIGIVLDKAENLKEYLKEIGILDPYYRTIKEKGIVYFPLKRELNKEEIKEIERKFGEIIIEKKHVLEKRKLLIKKQLLEEIKSKKEFYKSPIKYLAFKNAIVLEITEEDKEIEKEIIDIIKMERKGIENFFKIKNLNLIYKGYKPNIILGNEKNEIIYQDEDFKIKFNIEKIFIDPRLKFERNKLVNEIKSNELIAEFCSGSSFISLEIAKKREIKVYSFENDFDNYITLLENLDLNQIRGLVVPIFYQEASKLRKLFHNVFDKIIIWDYERSKDEIAKIFNFAKKEGEIILLAISREPEPHEDIQILFKHFARIIEIKTLLRLFINEWLVKVSLKDLFERTE